jgi:hypothetical protein
MLKFLVKLALAGLIANATWRLGSAYIQFYKFKDAVVETTRFGSQRLTDAQIEQRILELASQYDLPLAADRLTVRRDQPNHTIIDGSYEQPIDLVPGYRYQWPFTMHVDVLILAGALR